jgi:hypothetical protein
MSAPPRLPPPEPGPIEQSPWPEALTGQIATAPPAPRLHGYDVEGDLARHYSFAETILLTLTGALPAEGVGRAFEVALTFLAPVPVSEAPAHATVLASLVGADSSAVLQVGALALAERAWWLVREHAPLLAWLDRPDGAPPVAFRTEDPEERAAVARLRAAIAPTGLAVPALEWDLSRTGACLALCHACGLVRRDQLQAALVMAGLPCAFAEGMATRRGSFREYPMDLPAFRYEEGP